MATVLDALPPGSRVAVIRLRSLGDCVLTTPALEILKRARPDLQLGIVVESRFAAVFEGNPDIDRILRPGAAAMRNWRPELALNLHGGTRSAVLSACSSARFRAGFAHFRYRFLYNVRIPTAQKILQVERKVHTAEHIASAVFYLGTPVADIPRAKLFASAAAEENARSPYAILHPAASSPAKTWPAERFLRVAKHLKSALDIEPVFIAGSGEDLTPFQAYRTIIGASLEKLKLLLKRAALFVGNDSGPAHMAAAFGIPVVVMFGASDADVWRPWRTAAQVFTGGQGIGSIDEKDVIAALDRLRVPA